MPKKFHAFGGFANTNFENVASVIASASSNWGAVFSVLLRHGQAAAWTVDISYRGIPIMHLTETVQFRLFSKTLDLLKALDAAEEKGDNGALSTLLGSEAYSEFKDIKNIINPEVKGNGSK